MSLDLDTVDEDDLYGVGISYDSSTHLFTVRTAKDGLTFRICRTDRETGAATFSTGASPAPVPTPEEIETRELPDSITALIYV